MKRSEKRAQDPHPTTRWVTMLIEHIVCGILLFFPMVRLDYTDVITDERTLLQFVENTGWALPYRVLLMAFFAVVIAAVLPLAIKQVNKKTILMALIVLSSLLFAVNLTLYIVLLNSADTMTYYGLSLRGLPPTIPGVLYALVAVFAIMESIVTYRALCKAPEESTSSTEEEQSDEA